MMFPGQHMPMKTAGQKAARDAAYAEWVAAESERVRRQRLYLTSLRGPIRSGMVQRLLDRAWELLEANECEAADALLEFAPEAEATKLLDEFFGLEDVA